MHPKGDSVGPGTPKEVHSLPVWPQVTCKHWIESNEFVAQEFVSSSREELTSSPKLLTVNLFRPQLQPVDSVHTFRVESSVHPPSQWLSLEPCDTLTWPSVTEASHSAMFFLSWREGEITVNVNLYANNKQIQCLLTLAKQCYTWRTVVMFSFFERNLRALSL